MRLRKIISAFALFSITISATAQEEGWYRLTHQAGEDGKFVPVPREWEVYNYCFKNRDGGKTIFHYRLDSQNSIFDGEVSFCVWYDTVAAVKPKLPRISKEKPAPSGRTIYEPTDQDFKSRWFNNQPQFTAFPQNTWVTERWTRIKPPMLAGAIDYLVRYYEENDSTGFIGEWERTGFIETGSDGKETTLPTSRWCKAYGKHYSVCFMLPEEMNEETGIPPMVEMHGVIRLVEYISKDITRENGNPCIIKWIDNNKFHLTCLTEEGHPWQEIWERK